MAFVDDCVDVGADEFFVSATGEFVVGAEGWLVVFGHLFIVFFCQICADLCVFKDFLGVFDSLKRWLGVFLGFVLKV